MVKDEVHPINFCLHSHFENFETYMHTKKLRQIPWFCSLVNPVDQIKQNLNYGDTKIRLNAVKRLQMLYSVVFGGSRKKKLPQKPVMVKCKPLNENIAASKFQCFFFFQRIASIFLNKSFLVFFYPTIFLAKGFFFLFSRQNNLHGLWPFLSTIYFKVVSKSLYLSRSAAKNDVQTSVRAGITHPLH